MANALDFFISYTRADTNWAEWIAWQLEAAGYTVRLQAWDFRPGENFVGHMHDALAAARHVLAVYSPDYFSSGFAGEEWKAAVASDVTGRERRLIPVRVRPCTPPGLLAARIYIDIAELGEVEAAETLLSGIESSGRPTAAPKFPGSRGGSQLRKNRAPYPGSTLAAAESVSTVSMRAYANKYEMPGSYWRDLPASATSTFLLLGRTNKSWIQRSATQRHRFAEELVRIACAPGRCAILSEDTPGTRRQTLTFLGQHVAPLVAARGSAQRVAVESAIQYRVLTATVPYQAVRADTRIALLPLLNSAPFREESMVLELDLDLHPAQFQAYADDLERLIAQSEQVDWSKESVA